MTHFKRNLIATLIAGSFIHSPDTLGQPQGGTVVGGTAQFSQSGQTLNITNSPGAVIHWQQFNIGQGETTRFIQQSATSSVLNRVTGPDPSQIHGQLLSNGQVYLINPNGILFGPNAFVDVNQLFASTLNITDADFLARRMSFSGNGLGDIVNQGRLSSSLGGRIYLLGANVRNEGIITSPEGQVLLAAGHQVDLLDTAGPELTVSIRAEANRVVNLGSVNAQAGRIDMFGALIEQQGVVAANSASVDARGRIVLSATDGLSVSGQIAAVNSAGQGGEVRLTAASLDVQAGALVDVSGTSGGGQILAGGGERGQDPGIRNALQTVIATGASLRADALDQGNGGRVIVYATDQTRFEGHLSARGGSNAGNGGFVETSGGRISLGGTVDTSAQRGRVGEWLIDPARLCIYAVSMAECSSGSSGVYNSSGTFDSDTSDTFVNGIQPTSSLLSVSQLNGSISSTGISISAGELISVLPDGGQWVLPSGLTGSVSFFAPIVFLNGRLSNVGAGSPSASQSFGGNLQISAFGSAAQTSSIGPAGSIVFGSGAAILGGGATASLLMNASNFSFASGSVINMGRKTDPASADYSQVQMRIIRESSGPPGSISTSMSVPTLSNDGLSLTADTFLLSVPSILSRSGSASTLAVDVGQLALSYDYGDTGLSSLRLADPACVVSPSVTCLSGNFNDLVSGSVRNFEFSAFAFSSSTTETSSFGLDIIVAGPVSSPGQLTSIFSERNLTVVNPVMHGAGDLALSALQDLVVAAELGNPSGSILLTAGHALAINAPVSAARLLDLTRGSKLASAVNSTFTPGIFVNQNLTANTIALFVNPSKDSSSTPGSQTLTVVPSNAVLRLAQGVTLRATGTTASSPAVSDAIFGPLPQFNVSSGVLIELGQNAYIDNLAGVSLFSLEGLSRGWLIARAVADPALATATPLPPDNFGGLIPGSLTAAEFRNLICTDDTVCLAEFNNRFPNHTFAGFAVPAPAPVPVPEPAPAPVPAPVPAPTPVPAPEPVSVPVTDTSAMQQLTAAVTDPCLANPLLCAGVVVSTSPSNTSSPVQTRLAVANVGTTITDAPVLSAPLSIAAELVVRQESRIGVLNDMSAARETRAPAAAPRPSRDPVELVRATVPVAPDAGIRKAPSTQAVALLREAESARTEARAAQETLRQAETSLGKAQEVAQRADRDLAQSRTEVSKAQASVEQAETRVRSARSPQEKSAASKELAARRDDLAQKQSRAEMRETEVLVRKAEVLVKQSEAEAARVDAESRESRAESRQLAAQATDLRSAGGRTVAQQRAETKQVEAQAKAAEADVKRAEAQARRLEVEIRKAESEVKAAVAQARRGSQGERSDLVERTDRSDNGESRSVRDVGPAALKDADQRIGQLRQEVRRAESVLAEKREALEQKKSELESATGRLKSAETQRVGERRAEMAQMFGMMASARMGKASMETALALRQELKAEAFRDSLNLLDRKPEAADLPPCGGRDLVCVPPAASAVVLPPPDVRPVVSFIPEIERKVAVVIGVNDYVDPDVPSLDTALPDAQAIGQQLQDQFGYSVKTIPNGTRADIVGALNSLAREVGPNDSVTVYYAGHGYLNEKTGAGYWIPADGKAASPANWLSNRDITRLLNNIPARQMMLVSDSCYSGSLTKEVLTGSTAIANPSDVLNRRTVTVMSSGGEEPVSDEGKNGHSIFAFNFMNALKNIKTVGAGGSVFESVRQGVVQDAPQQPQYGGVISANHQAGGEFLFEVRSYR